MTKDYRDDKYWSQLTTPWTIEECELRYLYGRKISLVQLNGICGVAVKTLQRWCNQGGWVAKRTSLDSVLMHETGRKIVAQQSTKLADLLSDVEVEHAATFKKIREISLSYIDGLFAKMQECDDPIVWHGEISKNLDRLNTASLIIARSIEGERKALHLDFSDINVAYKVIEAAGMKVVLPGED